MKKIEIKNRWTADMLYATEVEDDDLCPVRTAVERANLVGANLVGANLAGANLVRANLVRANLDGANLVRANLVGANLDGANLDGANLAGANLDGANLACANLDGANLARAYLACANLDGANLARANLDGANLAEIREDIRAVLDAAPSEVAGLLAKLRAGEVDGSVYTGECACLVGTIANLRGCDVYKDLPPLIAPNNNRPAERFFLGISLGSTPSTNPIAAIVDDWICEWLAERGEGPWVDDETREVAP